MCSCIQYLHCVGSTKSLEWNRLRCYVPDAESTNDAKAARSDDDCERCSIANPSFKAPPDSLGALIKKVDSLQSLYSDPSLRKWSNPQFGGLCKLSNSSTDQWSHRIRNSRARIPCVTNKAVVFSIKFLSFISVLTCCMSRWKVPRNAETLS